MPVYKIVLAYDGTDYHGFQIQANALTVQFYLEKALAALYGSSIRVEGAGRTDAGVHARGQVVSFAAPALIPEMQLPPALNGLLPADIVVVGAQQVAESFSARRDARGKVYSYTIDNGNFPDVLYRRYAWHIAHPLDLREMQKAAAYLQGKHDFRAFQAAGSRVKTTVRTLFSLEVTKREQFISLYFKGDGFLYKMVRNITGTLAEVGRGRISHSEVARILEGKCREQAGVTAPARGLCLEKVLY
ncbi:MAG: tRNA pseudouridine(38-40) synthase TruA [Bacillota bacterium]